MSIYTVKNFKTTPKNFWKYKHIIILLFKLTPAVSGNEKSINTNPLTQTMQEKKISIGIDLGTTYSCASTYINNTVTIIHDSNDGKLTIPSVVYYAQDGSFTVGNDAVHKKAADPKNVFYDSKRLIGRNFDDPKVQKTIKNATFKVVKFDESKNKISNEKMEGVFDNMRYVRVNTSSKTDNASNQNISPLDLVPPHVISTEILRKIAQNARNLLGEMPTHAVITVPAYFEDQQKQTTKLAAMHAGFKEVRLVTEPVAAALAYGYQRIKQNDVLRDDKTVLVFDLGGGTLDVSIVLYNGTEQGEIPTAENLASSGNGFLGGRDFDMKLYEYAINEFLKSNPAISVDEIKDRSKRRLMIECERVKTVLSFSTQSTISVECFHGEVDLSVNISRFKFEQLCSSFFKACIEKIEEAMAEFGKCQLEFELVNGERVWKNRAKCLRVVDEMKSKIDNCILVGGSSRIPAIQKQIKEFFLDKDIDSSSNTTSSQSNKVIMPINPDEAIGLGAGFYAALLFGATGLSETDKIILIDSTSFDIGIETLGGIMTVLIPKGKSIPCKVTQTFSTSANNQTSVAVCVYTGEFKMVSHNNKIGDFSLEGIEAAPRGIPQIDVTIEVDKDGIIMVSAVDKKSNKSNKITIKKKCSEISQETVEVTEEIQRQSRLRDEEEFKRVSAVNEYNGLIDSCETALGTESNEEIKKKKSEIVQSHREWLAYNSTATEDVIRGRIKEFNDDILKVGGAESGDSANAGCDDEKCGG